MSMFCVSFGSFKITDSKGLVDCFLTDKYHNIIQTITPLLNNSALHLYKSFLLICKKYSIKNTNINYTFYVCRSGALSFCHSIYRSVALLLCLLLYLSVVLSFCRSTIPLFYLSICCAIHCSVTLSLYLSFCHSIYCCHTTVPSLYLSLC